MSAQGPARKAAETRDDWSTPWPLFEALDREFRFTLDAAASADNAKCEMFLSGPHLESACACGLCSRWGASRVFLNPPYGRGLDRWIGKAIEESDSAGATVVMLLPANTDTLWFAQVFMQAAEIRFLMGRVNFEGSTSTNTGGSMIAVFRRPRGFFPRPVTSLWDWRKP